MDDTVEISRSMVDAIIAEAAETRAEVCGLLLGLPHAGKGSSALRFITASPAKAGVQLPPSRDASAVLTANICQPGPRPSPGRREATSGEQDSKSGAAILVTSMICCRNVAADPAYHFEIDPAALIAAHRAARNGGPAIVGHYHSHPSGKAIPSAADAESAPPDGLVWLIVAGDAVTAWRAARGGAVEARFDPLTLAVAE